MTAVHIRPSSFSLTISTASRPSRNKLHHTATSFPSQLSCSSRMYQSPAIRLYSVVSLYALR